MHSYVALLRAVNVGSNQIKMDHLRAAFVRAGNEDVTTYIQSGNVLFASSLIPTAARDHVRTVIRDEFDKDVIVVIRTAEQIAGVCAGNPFLPSEQDASKLYVNYLSGEPTAAATATFMAAVAKTPDEVQIVGAHAYIRFANGAGTSKLTTAVWKKLGVDSTARNWNVTNKLAELAAAARSLG
ncbi:MAG: DUF1697 domain-containing protein [Ilumatobacteraceae bacterium]